jgi:hypothetical protein
MSEMPDESQEFRTVSMKIAGVRFFSKRFFKPDNKALALLSVCIGLRVGISSDHSTAKQRIRSCFTMASTRSVSSASFSISFGSEWDPIDNVYAKLLELLCFLW